MLNTYEIDKEQNNNKKKKKDRKKESKSWTPKLHTHAQVHNVCNLLKCAF